MLDMIIYHLIGMVVIALSVYVFPPVVVYVRQLPVRMALGSTFLCFIFLKEGACESVLRHELVHWEQQRRYTPVGVALFLGWHYGKALLRRIPFAEAWRNNPLEVEANKKMWLNTPLRHYWQINRTKNVN